MRTFRSSLLRHAQLLIPFLCLVIEGIVSGQEGDWEHMKRIVPNGYVCGIASVPLQIDGKLDEPSWMSAPWTEDFVDIEGEKKPKPRFRTRAKMLWDNDNFYIAAELFEPHLQGVLTQQDAVIFQDNDFEVFIDPNSDNHEYFELELNALNTTWDLFMPRPYKDASGADNSWEFAGLKSAVHLQGTLNDPTDQDTSWSVELAIPWAAFSTPFRKVAPPIDGEKWRIDFSRVEWQFEIEDGKYKKVAKTKEDKWVWSPQGIIDMHRPERWGFVQFSKELPGKSEFKHDASLASRDLLMEIYHRQRAFHAKHGRWSKKLSDLDFAAASETSANPFALRTTTDGYQASVIIDTKTNSVGKVSQELWNVRQDSKIWKSTESELIEAPLKRSGDNQNQLRGALDSCPIEQREGMEFLIANMPDRDLRTLTSEFLQEEVRLAYSKDERFDANDHLSVYLPKGQKFSLEIQDGNNVKKTPFLSEQRNAPITENIEPTEKASIGDHEPSESTEAIAALAKFLLLPYDGRPNLTEQSFASTPVSKKDAVEATRLLWKEHAERIRNSRAEEMTARVLTLDKLKMPFTYEVFGDKPATGRSMFISMHGGGGAPTKVNDQQWENQKKLYKLEEGVYVVPRAPTDTWDLWHQSHIDRLFDRLIENLIVLEEVDPNRIYIMGYSAGGDGVFQLSPRMADRWAAASMMAGHPNETSPLGLRNLPFTLHMGEKDSAYNRNSRAAEWEQKLADLHREDPEGYIHLVKIHADKGHWMDREDAVAIPWMAQWNRNLLPSRIVWKQDDVVENRFYWLAIDPKQIRERAEIVATRANNKIDVQSKDADRVSIRLSDDMVDLELPIMITCGSTTLFQGMVTRSIGNLAKTLAERGDPKAVFCAEVTVSIPKATP